jgi:ribonuclease M5
MRKLRLKEALVVEGRYDVNALSQVVDGVILETRGFGIFRDPERLALLRLYAETRGLIVLTDGDGAGFLIRNRIRGAVRTGVVKHAYIPDIYGKERRKQQPSKEGKLGVEGMPPEVLRECLERAGATFLDGTERGAVPVLTRTDMYLHGLSGGPDSGKKRRALALGLGLPERISAKGLLEALNALIASGRISPDILNADRSQDPHKEEA